MEKGGEREREREEEKRGRTKIRGNKSGRRE